MSDREFGRYTVGQISGILHCIDRRGLPLLQGVAHLSAQFHNAWFLGKDDKPVAASDLYPGLFPETGDPARNAKQAAKAETMRMLTEAIMDGAEIPQEELDRIKASFDGE